MKRSTLTSLIFLIALGLGAAILTAQHHVTHRATSHPLQASKPASSIHLEEEEPHSPSYSWIVDADQAQALINNGATLLDVRPDRPWPRPRIVGAVAVRWQDFSQTPPSQRGHLLSDDEALNQKLQTLGIFNHRPVVVIGDPTHGWGEEGRLVWMLRTLGHPQAVFVDGGHRALANVGLPTSTQTTTPEVGDFVVDRTPTWLTHKEDLKITVQSNNVPIIDARELREYNGATPYGEQRGGHIPGAIHLHYRDLLDNNGHLLPQDQLLVILKARGISPDIPVAIYCTGGVRSAWLTVVLSDLGFQAKNYAGSMWEWSAHPAEHYPLEFSES